MKKNCATTLFLLLIFISGYSQDLRYEVRGTYSHPITIDKLNEAKSMSDINPGYPSSWITDYISTEILATCNGKVMKTIGTNDILSSEQKNILSTADLGADIVIDVKYKHKNAATDNIDIETMHFSVTIIPEIEAEYLGGDQLMKEYLKENAIGKISEKNSKKLQQAIVRFTVNEVGEIANAQMTRTSGDKKTDKLLLRAISKMPKWKPAENSNGTKVKQEFEFSVNGVNVGC